MATIQQLEYLIGIYQTGSFTLAAEKLHITQPTISQAINSLEAELGIKILHRSRQGIVLTDEGKVIIGKAQEIILKMNELKEEINPNTSSLTGSLKIAIVPSICSSLLPKTLSIFKEKCPLVDIEIIENGSLTIVNDVLTGNIDLGIASIPTGLLNSHEDLLFEELASTYITVCLGKQFKEKYNNEITVEQIVQHPIVMFKSGYYMSQYIFNLLDNRGDIKILFTSDNTEVAKKVIIEGSAIGFYTELSLKNDPYLLNGDMISLNIKGRTEISTFYSIRSKNKYFSKAAKEFIKVLKTQTDNFIR